MRKQNAVSQKTLLVLAWGVACLLLFSGPAPGAAMQDEVSGRGASPAELPPGLAGVGLLPTGERSPFQSSPTVGLLPSDLQPPTVKRIDPDGFTTWTVDWGSSAYCIPVDVVRYPFDLGTQDSTQLSNTTLKLTFSQSVRDPNVQDPRWGVGLNGDPANGDWKLLPHAFLNNHPTWRQRIVPTTQVQFPFDPKLLIDGENNVWLKKYDLCPEEPGCTTCACTCIVLKKIELRASDFSIHSRDPEKGAKMVPVEAIAESGAAVTFTRPPDSDSVNEQTFQLYYLDESGEKVLVDGEVLPYSDVEYAFFPSAELLDGVRYHVRLWGKEDAEAAEREQWIKANEHDTPLVKNATWSFETMPETEVEIVALQAVEGTSFIARKPAVIKTFLRWDKKDGVHTDEQVKKITVEDIDVAWSSGGSDSGTAAWSKDKGWTPAVRDAKTTLRKREYREITRSDESYTYFERVVGNDSVNYYGFTPSNSGGYVITSRVLLKDHKGKEHPSLATQNVQVIDRWPFYMHVRAYGVGKEYKKTGPVDLSVPYNDNRSRLSAIYPMSEMPSIVAPDRMTLYAPPDPSLPWGVEPGSNALKKKLIAHLDKECESYLSCDIMVAFVSHGFLNEEGLSLTSLIAPFTYQGALVRSTAQGSRSYVMAHEIGHIAGFYYHQTIYVNNGHDVGAKEDKRYPAVSDGHIYDFMYVDPYIQGDRELWIAKSSYEYLMSFVESKRQAVRLSADPLLLVSGAITQSTAAVELSPWYQMEPGEWVPPIPGPYDLAFLDAGGQEIIGYTQAFTIGGELQYAGSAPLADGGPDYFNFVVPYPAATAKVQIREGAAVLAEIIPSANPPVIAIDPPPAGVWSGPRTLTWSSDAGERSFAVQVSIDNGTAWETLDIDQTAMSFTLETAGLPDTEQALVRILATDGLRTSTDTIGPLTIDNPPLVSLFSPADGAEHIGIHHPIYIGFRDPMQAASLNTANIILIGGPFGTVSGELAYDPENRQAIFTPLLPLAYDTVYTVQVGTGVQDAAGEALPQAVTWAFTTTQDILPPEPLTVSPQEGASDVSLDAALLVVWDKDLNPATLSTATFTLSTASGQVVDGVVSYEAASRTARFVPAASLAQDTFYRATLKAGIEDMLGNATQGETSWIFTTGRRGGAALAFGGAFSDSGEDENGDGLYESLVIRVGVQISLTGDYQLSGALLDLYGAQIATAQLTTTLPAGAGFVELRFDGAPIGGHGVDGPYALTELTLSRAAASTALQEAYRTYAYRAGQFASPLYFNGLPDQNILPGTASVTAFNLHDYADHDTLSTDQLTYTLWTNTVTQLGVTIQPDGNLQLTPQSGWSGQAEVTLQASDGAHSAQDTFLVTTGWPVSRYLPAVMKSSQGEPAAPARDAWRDAFLDDFEDSSLLWKAYSSISIPPGGWYSWARRDCASASGSYSAWPFGGSSDGEALACGANYPDTLVSKMCRPTSVNLKYTTQAELRAKVWTDLAPGDQVCLTVAVAPAGGTFECWELESSGSTDYFKGVCRSGTTQGWENMVLDLANVPGLGSLLGEERVWVQLKFETDESGSRPGGAYVDDVQVRMCPQGLACDADSAASVALSNFPVWLGASRGQLAPATAAPETAPLKTAPPKTVALENVAGIGGYTEVVQELSLAVEESGRIHALWIGTLNPSFNRYVFYSSSTDGVNWSPYQVLHYWDGYDPRVVVDQARRRAHLVYRSRYDGILHHTVENGVVSPPDTLAASGAFPSVAVDESSGNLYAAWRELYAYPLGDSISYRYRTRHAYWQEGAWSAPIYVVNDDDTWDSALAVSAEGGVMLTWFQRWTQSLGGPSDPGEATIPRTAYGTQPSYLPLRQAVSAEYPLPEKDNSILLAYAGGEDAFILAAYHLMWPGHSLFYRYRWEDGDWSAPLDVAENTSDWAVPVYVGAAADRSLIRYIYNEAGVLKMRSESGGVLGSVQTLADYLAARGYSANSAQAYFVDPRGDLHMLVVAEKDGQSSLYYVAP